MIGSKGVQAVPIRFHGNPVNRRPRSHSPTVQASARPTARGTPGAHTRVASAASAGYIASAAETPSTAGATSQAKRSGSVIMAMPNQ